MDDRSTIALIPARAGSKRLPRKNAMMFCGRPMIDYTVQAALESDCFSRVVVSSDDDEILEIAKASGSDTDRRPSALGGDDVGVVEVCLEYLARAEVARQNYQRLAVLYATAPMRTAADVRATMALLDHPDCNFAIAATDYSHYAHQALLLGEDDFVQPKWPACYPERPRDIGHLVAGNGSTYCVKVDAFQEVASLLGEGTRIYLMPRRRSIDIDTLEDFQLAEHLASMPAGTLGGR